jgi:hypothetical protein
MSCLHLGQGASATSLAGRSLGVENYLTGPVRRAHRGPSSGGQGQPGGLLREDGAHGTPAGTSQGQGGAPLRRRKTRRRQPGRIIALQIPNTSGATSRCSSVSPRTIATTASTSSCARLPGLPNRSPTDLHSTDSLVKPYNDGAHFCCPQDLTAIHRASIARHAAFGSGEPRRVCSQRRTAPRRSPGPDQRLRVATNLPASLRRCGGLARLRTPARPSRAGGNLTRRRVDPEVGVRQVPKCGGAGDARSDARRVTGICPDTTSVSPIEICGRLEGRHLGCRHQAFP